MIVKQKANRLLAVCLYLFLDYFYYLSFVSQLLTSCIDFSLS